CCKAESGNGSLSSAAMPPRVTASAFLDDLDAFGKTAAVDLDSVVAEGARRRVVVDVAVDFAEGAVDVAADPDAVEQGMRRRIAHGVRMLEDDQLARGHLPARGGTIVFEHAAQCFEQQRKVRVGKACA